MNQLQNKSFEEALVRYREKWDKIKDPCVVYDFPIPDVSCKELFLKRVSEHPDKTYVISRGTKMSYVECNTLAAKIANGFLAKGLKKGDRVITYVSNGFEFVALAHACFKTGIIMVNTNPRSTADEIIRRIKDCTPKMVITDSDDASEPDISISPEDIAILQYTGGTTGVLKGCCQTNHAFVAKAMAQVQYFRPFLNDNDYENYMVIIALGMSHAFGFGQGIVVNLTMGGTIFFAESLDEILRVIEKYRPTVWPSVPLWMKLIATHEEYQKYDISSLKVITCGSAPLPVDVIRRVEELTGAVITEGYGMTETVNTITINGHDHRKVGTVGVVNPNIEYLIVDQETGTEVVEDGQPGEIICRGECVMHEYWNNPEETAKMLRNGWLYTGDIGRIDEEGFLIICDRKKDLIITGGFNVFPSELEAVAITAENVADAIAIGVPNERRGEVPAIFVQPIAGKTVDLNEVERVCREKLSRFKVPKEYYIMDMLPKTKNRKPDRKMVKKLYLEHAFDDQKKEQ